MCEKRNAFGRADTTRTKEKSHTRIIGKATVRHLVQACLLQMESTHSGCAVPSLVEATALSDNTCKNETIVVSTWAWISQEETLSTNIRYTCKKTDGSFRRLSSSIKIRSADWMLNVRSPAFAKQAEASISVDSNGRLETSFQVQMYT